MTGRVRRPGSVEQRSLDRLAQVPTEVRRLVRELGGDELQEVAEHMGASAEGCKAGAYRAKENGAPKSHVTEGLALGEAFTHAELDAVWRAARYRGHYVKALRPREKVRPGLVGLFDIGAAS